MKISDVKSMEMSKSNSPYSYCIFLRSLQTPASPSGLISLNCFSNSLLIQSYGSKSGKESASGVMVSLESSCWYGFAHSPPNCR